MEYWASGFGRYVWKRFLTLSAEDCQEIITQEIKALHDSYTMINANLSGRRARGRIFIFKAVILLCAESSPTRWRTDSSGLNGRRSSGCLRGFRSPLVSLMCTTVSSVASCARERWPFSRGHDCLNIMGKFTDIREECCEANRALGSSGLVDLTFGNVSVLDVDAAVFAIKPSGVDYAALTPGKMVLVDLEGRVVEAGMRPSSDTPTHRRLLQAFSGIRSVVHTHSRYAVTFAQACREIPLMGTTHADYFRGPVPVTRALTSGEIGGDYELATGSVIVESFAEIDPHSVPAVLVRHHGPFTWGETGTKAVETAAALEIIAQMSWQTLCLEPMARHAPEELRDKHFFRKHGSGAYYGQLRHS